MGRSSLAGGIVAAIIGGIVGFLGLFLREMGLVLAAVVVVIASLSYVRSGRGRDVGWLLLGAGVVPTVILGRNALTAYVDPAVEVGPDTWLLLAGFAVVASAGAIVVGVSLVAPKGVK